MDCVRFADLGLVGERPDLIVSGINYGYNLGDDVTYSGTVAAAFEGILLGIPGIAISQGSPTAPGATSAATRRYDFEPPARFLAALVEQVAEHGLPDGTILNVNVPADPDGRRGRPAGQADLPRPARARGGRGGAPPLPHLRRRPVVPRRAGHGLPGDRRRAAIAVTPIHLDLTSDAAIDELSGWNLGG